MPELDDIELLQYYANGGSEEAFATLVARHVNLVYSVALRHVGNSHHAEEITQAVFLILAQKAGRLNKKTILAGWLHQTARFTAANFLRSETQRTRREQEAYMQSILNQPEPDVWPQLAPLLDTAIAGLSEKDRDAVVLRYFEGRRLSEVGAALGTSEEAAKKRVDRAVDKLRRFFTRRGVVLSATALATTISVNSVQAAPASLVVSVSAAAAKGTTVSTSTLTLMKGVLKLMAWTKAKTAAVAGAALLLTAGITTITTKKIQEHRTYPWQVPNASFGVFYKLPAEVKIVPTKFSENGNWVCDGGRGTMGIAQPVEEIAKIAYQKDRSRTIVSPGLPSGKFDFVAKLSDGNNMGSTSWAEALQRELKTRLGVVGKMETRETEVLLLKCQNHNASGLKPADSLRRSLNLPKGIAARPGNGQFEVFNQRLGTLISFLEQRFQIPIVDQTSLSDKHDFILKWNEPDPKQPNDEGLKQALLDQLGLELVPSREPIEMLIVERASK